MKRILLMSVTLCAGIFVTGQLSAKTYRWVDADGKVHYSQSIPPSAAQNGHKEITDGVIVGEVESREKRAEQKARAMREAEYEEIRKKRARENLMIQLFSSEDELKSHYNSRISMISTNIRLLQFHKKRMKNDIDEIREKMDKHPSGKIHSKLKSHMLELQRNLLEHSRAIEVNQQEQADVRKKMDEALVTYRNNRLGKSETGMDSILDAVTTSAGENSGGKSCNCSCKPE